MEEMWLNNADHTLRKYSVSERISNNIIEKIYDGELNPGDKLPSLRKISSLFDVSIPTVREALKTLEARNIVLFKHGKGVFITENPGKVEEPFGMDLVSIDNPLTLSLEARLAYEPMASYFAAERATKDNLKAIKTSLDNMITLVEKGERHIQADLNFHASICEASHNPFLVRIHEAVTGYYEKVAHQGGYSKKIPNIVEEAIMYHTKIYEALKEKSSEKASCLMKKHILNTLDAYSEIV